jgi:hypothetical protein
VFSNRQFFGNDVQAIEFKSDPIKTNHTVFSSIFSFSTGSMFLIFSLILLYKFFFEDEFWPYSELPCNFTKRFKMYLRKMKKIENRRKIDFYSALNEHDRDIIISQE